jgi:DNA excision repair protein ERCC-6-like 2
VQGDSQKEGELFGVRNIFKLHEGKLATKQAVSLVYPQGKASLTSVKIEKANIAELDWALANLPGGKLSKKASDPGGELAYEADMKGGKDEVCNVSYRPMIGAQLLFARVTFVG